MNLEHLSKVFYQSKYTPIETETTTSITNYTRQELIDKIARIVSYHYKNTISVEGVKFLISHEGIVENWYSDNGKTNGYQTIGIGHLMKAGEKVKLNSPLSTKEIIELLIEDLKVPIQSVKNLSAERELTQNQKDALISFIFNIGSGNWAISSVRRIVSRQGDINSGELKTAFNKFITSQKVVLNGLIRRRKEEFELFMR